MQTQNEFMDRVLKYDDALRRAALKFCHGNLFDSEDAVQSTYLKALKNKDKFRTNINLKAWLVQILHNIVYSSYRHKEVMKETSITEEMKEIFRSKEDSTPGKDEISDDLARGLNKILPKHKQIFELAAEGLPIRDIAKKLNVAEGTVMSGTWRARQILEAAIKDRDLHQRGCSKKALRDRMRILGGFSSATKEKED